MSVFSARCIAVEDISPRAWRNGGGRTREMLAWPSAKDWMLRVSVADIDTDGPFSTFPGVQRWFAVIAGAGVCLGFLGRERCLVAGDAPLNFDGGVAPDCRLLDGPTRDLNLMLRCGRGTMRPAQPAVAWGSSTDEAFAMRGLFAAVAGRWSDGCDSMTVAAQTLLWGNTASTAPWTFRPDQTVSTIAGWWLGFTPEGASP